MKGGARRQPHTRMVLYGKAAERPQAFFEQPLTTHLAAEILLTNLSTESDQG
jgi:hypothetical protein